MLASRLPSSPKRQLQTRVRPQLHRAQMPGSDFATEPASTARAPPRGAARKTESTARRDPFGQSRRQAERERVDVVPRLPMSNSERRPVPQLEIPEPKASA